MKSIKRGSSNLPFTIDIVLAPVVFFRISNIVNEFYILTSKNTFFNTLIFFLPKNDLKNTEGLEEIYLVVVVSYFFRSLSKNSLKKALRRMTNDKKIFFEIYSIHRLMIKAYLSPSKRLESSESLNIYY